MAEEAVSVNLRILSPSTEVEDGVNLPDLPATTTIRELRQRIHDAAPSRPATERMRLIYRGRVVANENDSLADVFGADNIRESKDQSLHLVLRELPASSTPSPAPRSVTAPPNPLQSPQGTPRSPLQTNPFRNLPEARPNSQPSQVPQPHHHHHPHPHLQPHHHHHLHPPPLNAFGPRPIPLPPHLQQQFAQAIMNQNPQGPNQPGTPPSGDGAQVQQVSTQPAMGLPNLPSGTTRTVRQEGIGPNGERWTVTWNNTNVALNPNQHPPILPRPFPHPGPGFGLAAQRTPSPSLGSTPEQRLQRIRRVLDHARVDVDNLRVLLQPPLGQSYQFNALADVSAPAWRLEQVRHSVRNLIAGLDTVDRGLASLVADPQMAQNRDFVSLQQAAADLRRQAQEFSDQLARSEASDTETVPPTTAFPEMFILMSPQGPVGILYDQRGTYSTAPTLMPFQSFSQRFNANQQHVRNLGRQLGMNGLQNRLPAQATAPIGNQPAAVQQPNQIANPAQAQNQDQNAQPPPAVADPNNRVDNIAGHLWLIFKLACFVYFFSGGGGWYRPIMICFIAGVVYLAQVGIFEDHFTAVRQYLETLLPPGALGVPQDPNRPNVNPNAQGQRAEPDRNLSPEQAARRLQQQHRDQRFGWVRDTMRTTERAFAIFVASLWPGIGERMVQAQEERVRAERVAEEERVAAEEARRREEEEKREQEAREQAEGEKRDDRSVDGEAGSKSEGKKARVEDVELEADEMDVD